MSRYIDTSALAKWYISEPQSERFEAFVRDLPEALVSQLATADAVMMRAAKRLDLAVHGFGRGCTDGQEA